MKMKLFLSKFSLVKNPNEVHRRPRSSQTIGCQLFHFLTSPSPLDSILWQDFCLLAQAWTNRHSWVIQLLADTLMDQLFWRKIFQFINENWIGELFVFTNRKLGFPFKCPRAVNWDPQVDAAVEVNLRHNTSGSQYSYYFGHGSRRVLAVSPAAVSFFIRYKIIRFRIRVVSEAGTSQIDLLAAKHVAISGPYE